MLLVSQIDLSFLAAFSILGSCRARCTRPRFLSMREPSASLLVEEIYPLLP